MVSGSLPSTSSCNPFWAKASGSSSATDSRPSSPSLRATWLQLTMRSMASCTGTVGGKNTHEAMRMARMKVARGDCSITAPTVPPSTMRMAGPLSSDSTCPPSRC